MCQEIFNLYFVPDSNPSGHLTKWLKSIFKIFFYFAEIFQFLTNSALSITPRKTKYLKKLQSPSPRCESYRGVKLRVCIITRRLHGSVTNQVDVCRQRRLALRCASLRGVSSLPSVCSDPNFYNCYFSVMP